MVRLSLRSKHSRSQRLLWNFQNLNSPIPKAAFAFFRFKKVKKLLLNGLNIYEKSKLEIGLIIFLHMFQNWKWVSLSRVSEIWSLWQRVGTSHQHTAMECHKFYWKLETYMPFQIWLFSTTTEFSIHENYDMHNPLPKCFLEF